VNSTRLLVVESMLNKMPYDLGEKNVVVFNFVNDVKEGWLKDVMDDLIKKDRSLHVGKGKVKLEGRLLEQVHEVQRGRGTQVYDEIGSYFDSLVKNVFVKICKKTFLPF